MRQERSQAEVVEESMKTRRAREKLQKQLLDMQSKVTAAQLQKKIVEIYRWISLNAAHRVVLETKIALFDENQNAAAVSKKIVSLVDQLKTGLLRQEVAPSQLLQELVQHSHVEEKVSLR